MATGAVVAKSIPPYAVAAGVPRESRQIPLGYRYHPTARRNALPAGKTIIARTLETVYQRARSNRSESLRDRRRGLHRQRRDRTTRRARARGRLLDTLKHGFEATVHPRRGSCAAISLTSRSWKAFPRGKIRCHGAFCRRSVHRRFAAQSRLVLPCQHERRIVPLEAVVCAGVKQIVFSSTAAAYGQPERVPTPGTHRKSPAIRMANRSWSSRECWRGSRGLWLAGRLPALFQCLRRHAALRRIAEV